MAIKPSGVGYDELGPDSIVVVDLEGGAVVEGTHRPSSDTPTHLVVYRAFPDVAGIVHTHSPFATAWAQACREIPCFGTTHADHFQGPVPVTRSLTAEEIAGDYEAETGAVIVETLAALGLEPLEMPAVLVASHGPFAWGADTAEAVENAVALEAVAAAALRTEQLRAGAGPIAEELLLRHFSRKHGPGGLLRPGAMTTPVMKALRLHGPGDLRLHDEPEPQPGDGEALLRVTAVGLCGSDRHWFVEGSIGDAVLRQPLVLGHEFVGRIESGPRAGERVVADPADPCLACSVCLAGKPHLCAALRFAGHGSTDGALRTLLAWPERLLHPLPDSLPDAEAVLLEPLGVALHALDLGPVRPGTAAGGVRLRAARAAARPAAPYGRRLGRGDRASCRTGSHAADCSSAPPRSGGRARRRVRGRRRGRALAAARRRAPARRPRRRRRDPGRRPHQLHRLRCPAEGADDRALPADDSCRPAPRDPTRRVGAHRARPLVTGRYPLADWERGLRPLVERRGLKAVVEP